MWCAGEECGRDGEDCPRSFFILAVVVNAIPMTTMGEQTYWRSRELVAAVLHWEVWTNERD